MSPSWLRGFVLLIGFSAAGNALAAGEPAPAGVEIGGLGLGFVSGRVWDPEAERPKRDAMSGTSFAAAARMTLPGGDGWYWRPFGSVTQLRVSGNSSGEAGEVLARGGLAFGREWEFGELAVGIGALTGAARPAWVLPTFHGRLGSVSGPRASLSLLDDRGPLHGLGSFSVGYGLGPAAGFDVGMTITENESIAGFGELHLPVREGIGASLYLAQGTRRQSILHSEWMQGGVRLRFTFP